MHIGEPCSSVGVTSATSMLGPLARAVHYRTTAGAACDVIQSYAFSVDLSVVWLFCKAARPCGTWGCALVLFAVDTP